MIWIKTFLVGVIVTILVAALKDLKGRTVAITDAQSFDGWLIAQGELARQGLAPEHFFSLDVGLPTRIIKQILPCLDKPRVIYFDDATPEMIDILSRERDRMDELATSMLRNRDAIASYLDEVISIRDRQLDPQ